VVDPAAPTEGTAVAVPVLERLVLSGYGMFPGRAGDGLAVDFRPGLTLVLGANALGKSTLVLLLYRMLSGPFDIPGLTDSRELGTTRLESGTLTSYSRTVFARRVSDGARAATASLTFGLGMHQLCVERRLSDLELTGFRVDGAEAGSDDVADFQATILRFSGLGSFADWILLLRHLVFYFEDRRALVWDQSAQRQVLRLLLLPAPRAAEWTALERDILERDSHMRNLAFALTREERDMSRAETKTKSAPDVRAELLVLEPLQDNDSKLHEAMEQELVDFNERREATRLRLLQAEQIQDAALRDLERIKLLAVGTSFPSSSDSARYVLSQLMAGDECLVCGHIVPAVAAQLFERVQEAKCVVCGSDTLSTDGISSLDHERLARAVETMAGADAELAAARSQHTEAEQAYRTQLTSVTQLGSTIAKRAQRIELLVTALPPDEAVLHERRSEISILRTRVAEIREVLTARRAAFAAFIDEISRTIVSRSAEIEAQFEGFAHGFLMEDCALVWAPHQSRVGQTGEAVSFPSFDLSLTGSDFAAPTRRAGPGDVSESQREFIDLAFRMALMTVAGANGVGSLVIDAPESSLDAVFTSRASEVLARFAGATNENRLVLASNLVEGSLIPSLIAKGVPSDERADRIVDLFELAVPTAAIRAMRSEYRSLMRRLTGEPES
jgi:hypothetical protein